MTSSSQSLIPLTAGTLAAGFLGLGALHFSTPFRLCEFFGVPSSPASLEKLQRPDARPFIYANGGREVMLGIAFWIMGRQRNREGINALLYGMFVAAQVDACVVWVYGGEKYGGWRGRWMMHSLGGFVVGLIAWNDWSMY